MHNVNGSINKAEDRIYEHDAFTDIMGSNISAVNTKKKEKQDERAFRRSKNKTIPEIRENNV